jgi:hypothetical protein
VVLTMLGMGVAGAASAVTTTLVPAGSVWRYLDDGSNQGTAWRAAGFDDSAWASGPAELGYGDGDEATVVSFGPSSGSKYVTTYFRRSFSLADPSAFARVDLGLRRDDGAVVYLNGVEVFRSNLPAGTISSSTLASAAVGGSDESRYFLAAVDPSLLVAGANVLAVEIHQSSGSSSDISFDLTLAASTTVESVVRGPYLQLGTPHGVVVRWRTDLPTASRVVYGSDPGALTESADGAGPATEHEVELTDLAAATDYFYGVGYGSEILAGGDASHAFRTAPPAGQSVPARIWVLGDSGTANANARAVRDAYRNWPQATIPELWLMLGDNAYPDGTDAQYEAAVFDTYPEELRTSVLWSTIGNHDDHTTDPATGLPPYFGIFTLPAAGEAGGVPSGSEAYYAFDWGAIHFVCLDSQRASRAVGGPMLTWLEQDLAATDAEWIVAFWHHPPYSKGSHNSDSETQLEEMRENALPILEEYGVDLVLAGHSHAYERSFLVDGHYGLSTTLDPSMVVDGGDGDPAGDGAYAKPLGATPHQGAVYTVAGSSGQVSASGNLDHPVMVVSLRELGSLVLDIDGATLRARFLDDEGVVRDDFSIVKGGGAVCGDGTCAAGEDCASCPADCPSAGGAACGNGVCETADGEDCLSCALDCNGQQGGKPAARFCCGDGAGTNPLTCGAAQCSTGGFHCTAAPAAIACCGDGLCDGAESPASCALDCGAPPTCGDGVCDPSESRCGCALDCGAPPVAESLCADGFDDDCDGAVDCADLDCAGQPICGACALLPPGAACTAGGDCCSGSCRGKPGAKTCK